jgi:hypothetical protein
MASLLINELLCFLSVQNDKLVRDNIHSIIHEFYSLEDVVKAKQTLIEEFEKVLSPDLIKDSKTKRQERSSGAKQKVTKDVLDIWEVLDRENGGKLNSQFVAANPNNLPSVNAEKFNLQFLIASILKLQELSASQQQILSDVSESVTQINKHLNSPPGPVPALVIPASETNGVTSPLIHTPVAVTPKTAEPSGATPTFMLGVTGKATDVGFPATSNRSNNSSSNINYSCISSGGNSSSESDSRSSSSGGSSSSGSGSSSGSSSRNNSSKKRKLDSTAAIFTPAKQLKSVSIAQQPNLVTSPSISATPPAVASTSFAAKARELQTKPKKWTLVQARKNKNIIPIVGKDRSSTLEGVPRPTKDYWEISVLRLKDTTTEDQVRTHLQGQGIDVKEVYVFPSKIRGTKSSKVRVALEQKDRVKDENLWPQHCKIQDWINKPKSARKPATPTTGSENGSS